MPRRERRRTSSGTSAGSTLRRGSASSGAALLVGSADGLRPSRDGPAARRALHCRPRVACSCRTPFRNCCSCSRRMPCCPRLHLRREPGSGRLGAARARTNSNALLRAAKETTEDLARPKDPKTASPPARCPWAGASWRATCWPGAGPSTCARRAWCCAANRRVRWASSSARPSRSRRPGTPPPGGDVHIAGSHTAWAALYEEMAYTAAFGWWIRPWRPPGPRPSAGRDRLREHPAVSTDRLVFFTFRCRRATPVKANSVIGEGVLDEQVREV